MNNVKVATFILLAMLAPAKAQQLYVAKFGNDDNTCMSQSAPCLTIQGAINKVPGGSLGVDIDIADGTYNEMPNIYYHRAIRLRGNCSNLSSVQIIANSLGILVQDHAIGILQCLTIAAGTTEATGILSRQYSIVDAVRLRFSGFPLVQNIIVGDSSTLTCAPGPNGEPVVVTGSSTVFISISRGSRLNLNCPIFFEDQSAFSYFMQCIQLSICDLSQFSWAGSKITGKQFYCDNSDLTQPIGAPPAGYIRSIPGDGFDNPESRCRLR